MKALDNRGVTLLEVIVTVLLLGIITIPTLKTFEISRILNSKSGSYVQSEMLANSIIEQLEDLTIEEVNTIYESRSALDYSISKDLLSSSNPYCKLKVPDLFVYNDIWDITKLSDTEYKLSANTIKGDRIRLNAEVNLKSTELNNINSFTFPIISNLYGDDTCIIDPTGISNIYNKNSNGEYVQKEVDGVIYYDYDSTDSFDSRVLSYYEELNNAYVEKKWKQRCDEIDILNEQYADLGLIIEYPILGEGEYVYTDSETIKSRLKRCINVNINKEGSFTFVDCNITYRLVQELDDGTWLEIIEPETEREFENDKREMSYNIINNQKFAELNNVYFMYTSLSSDWLGDDIIIQNGNDMYSVDEFNLYIDKQPLDSEGNKCDTVLEESELGRKLISLGHNTIKINSESPDKLIRLYTNTNLKITDLIGASIVDDTVHKILSDENEPSQRMYEVDIKITEHTGDNVYIKKYSTVLN